MSENASISISPTMIGGIILTLGVTVGGWYLNGLNTKLADLEKRVYALEATSGKTAENTQTLKDITKFLHDHDQAVKDARAASKDANDAVKKLIEEKIEELKKGHKR